MRFAWLTGWATSAASTERAAQAWCPGEHAVVLPGPNWQRELLSLMADDRVLCGYSTGAYLLLREEKLLRAASRAFLFAPFLQLTVEAECGGRAERRVLQRWRASLPDQPERIVRTFRRWVRLPADPEARDIEPSVLDWGLEQLLEGAPARPDCPESVRLVVGGSDPLVDADALKCLLPRLQVAAGVGHGLADLLAAASAP